MPASEAHSDRRGKLLHGLFWGGVGLAPIAILILLFSQGIGGLRVAVVLSVLTIVMLAVSMVLRPSIEMVRVDIEHRILDEIERVRLRAREDITVAARNTHRALSDKIHMLGESVEDLRVHVDEARASAAILQPAPAATHAPPQQGVAGVVRRTETVHVTHRTTTVDAGEEDARGTVYGSRAAVDGEWRERPDTRRHDAGTDERDERDERDQRADERWDGTSAADRWASVHADDQGREFRVGERRSSVRSDDRGTELRVEDRWASVRRDDDHREPDWEANFRAPGSRSNAAPALPPAQGEPPSRYIDDRDHDTVRSRGRLRESARERRVERENDRGRDDRGRDADGGGYDRERAPETDRVHEPERARDADGRRSDRHRADRDPGSLRNEGSRSEGSHRSDESRGEGSDDRDNGYEWDSGPLRDSGHQRDKGHHRDAAFDREPVYDRNEIYDPDAGYQREPTHQRDPGQDRNHGHHRDTGHRRDPASERDPGHHRDPDYDPDTGSHRNPGHHRQPGQDPGHYQEPGPRARRRARERDEDRDYRDRSGPVSRDRERDSYRDGPPSYDRDYDRDRGYAPRPRSPHPYEYDR